MIKKTRIFAILSVALMAGVTLAKAEDIVIGGSAPMSGAQAEFGQSQIDGAELFFDQLNEKGGIKGNKVVLKPLDDRADPRQGTLVAQQFCDDTSVVGVIGHMNSGVTMPALDIYSECGMPQIVPATNPELMRMGFKTVVRPVANDFIQGALPAKYVANTLGLKKAVTVHDKTVFGQGIAGVFKTNFEESGGKVSGTYGVNPEDVDFSSLIASIKRENPDVLYMGSGMPQLALFLKQMREQGMTAQFIGPDIGFTEELIKQAGPAFAEGAILSFQLPPYDSSDALKEFSDRHKKRFGREPGPYAALGYVNAQVMAAALEEADQYTREGVLKPLKTIKADTLLGPVEFDEAGENKFAPMFLYVVKNGKFELIKQ
ncbi:branched-chain amino acid ABC transporter substrate-binding protein [Ochrobactrum chromiisoli]|uniref:Branched-chain amino acid ABC transporter substrate-binding protein n=1 Tax=Ochrobactrum chromiisoli TaxID=2993941 RepID=A0ABT3QSW0_9HYPH|nr:branched-chain amino acid ABC transporter substrate-binding protein [Ochrobactrum chromiisoli]MCX2698706.1 branched-chain amino acid ABC transporter substrate-binding protein [Ochrobactrum chromiisoli]